MIPLAFLQNVGMFELIIILGIMLLLFGHRLPGVGRAMGRSVGEFKAGLKEGEVEADKIEAAAREAKETKDAKEVHKEKAAEGK